MRVDGTEDVKKHRGKGVLMPSFGTLRPPPVMPGFGMERSIGTQLAVPSTKVGMLPRRSVGKRHGPQRVFHSGGE